MGVNLYLLSQLSSVFAVCHVGWMIGAYLMDAALLPYAVPTIITGMVAMTMSLWKRRVKRSITLVEGAFFLLCSWLYLTLVGMMPFVLSSTAQAADAFLVAASALSTTMPLYAHAEIDRLLFAYQIFLGYFGGMHFLVLIFTVLPVVGGCFGISLTAGGEDAYSPLLARMRVKGRAVMLLYALWTSISALAYGGMGAQAGTSILAAMATVSTLGFGLDGAHMVDMVGATVIVLLTVLSGTSNLLWQRALEKRSWRLVISDGEFLYYLRVMAIAILLLTLAFLLREGMPISEAVSTGMFYAASFLTTSGSLLEVQPNFPSTINFMLLLFAFIGCSIGSAGGGLSPVRLRILLRAVREEVRRSLHPRMVVTISAGAYLVPHRTLGRILVFFFLYVGTFVLAAIVLSLAGLGAMPAIALSAGCLTATGTLYTVFAGVSLFDLPLWTKMTACLLMLLGRVEIFACLVLIAASVGKAATGKWRE